MGCVLAALIVHSLPDRPPSLPRCRRQLLSEGTDERYAADFEEGTVSSGREADRRPPVDIGQPLAALQLRDCSRKELGAARSGTERGERLKTAIRDRPSHALYVQARRGTESKRSIEMRIVERED